MNKIKYEQLPTVVRVAIQFALISLSTALLVAAIIGFIYFIMFIFIPYLNYMVGIALIIVTIIVAIDTDKERMKQIRIKKVAASIHEEFPLVSTYEISKWLTVGYNEEGARIQAMLQHEKEKFRIEEHHYRERMAEQEFSNVKYRR